MKKFFSTLAGFIVLAIVILAICVFFGWSRIPDMVANGLSKKMKVAVEIEDIKLKMDSITISNLDISNPRGSLLPKALSVETIAIDAPLKRYLSSDIVIDQIKLDNVYVSAEFDAPDSKRGNWTTIMENMKSSSPPSSEKKGKSVLIKKLVLNNVNVDLAYRNGGGQVKHLSPIKQIVFTDVTSEGGIPSEQITNLILQQALKSIFERENIQNMMEGFMQSPQQGVENALSPLKNFFP